jgi:hypothetical protein
MGLIHVLHASRRVTFLHRRLRHVEMHRGPLFLGGVDHLGDHVIHLFHMGIVALVTAKRTTGKDRQMRGEIFESLNVQIHASNRPVGGQLQW